MNIKYLTVIISTIIILSCTQNLTNNNLHIINIKKLSPGKSIEVNWKNRPIVIYHRTTEDIDKLIKLKNDVFQVEDVSKNLGFFRSKDVAYFIGILISPYSKCKVRFISTTEKKSLGFENWPSGFICPCSAIPYDLAGRTIKPGKFSPSGWTKPTSYLDIPPYHFENENLIIGNL